MNILHIVDVKDTKSNGVAVAVSNYVKFENKKTNVAIYNLDAIVGGSYNNFSYEKYKRIEELPSPFNKPDLVIFNEIYKPKYIKLYKECIKLHIKYVIIPHGSLVKEAQKKSKIKKIIGNFFLFNRFIYKANAIQFLNEDEMNQSNFKYKKSLISSNGIDINKDIKNIPDGKRFVYIGRYSIHVKGLDLLVAVCEKYKDYFEDNKIDFYLYGSDSENGLFKLKQLVKEKKLEKVIKINNPVFDKEKVDVLKKSYAFIQLSRHEGQPMGVIEALSYGVPCIVTYNTSFVEYVDKYKCGYGCNFDVDDVFQKITLILNETDRNILSKNATLCINRDFNNEIIIKKLLKEYKVIVNDI